MKQLLIATAVALACSAALAQTPSTPANPAKAVEQGAVPTAPRTAAAAEAKVDARQGANPGASATTAANPAKAVEQGAVPTTSRTASKAEMNVEKRDMAAMDTNGDGMISRKEYDAYHGNMWKKMTLKNGMAMQADVQMMLKQGLGGM